MAVYLDRHSVADFDLSVFHDPCPPIKVALSPITQVQHESTRFSGPKHDSRKLPDAGWLIYRGHSLPDEQHATPDEARNPPEKLAYVVATYAGTGIARPDYLATLDLDPASPTYSRIIHRASMPNVGDELHHFGWNACGSCHGKHARRYLIVPGLTSSRIHILDTADPRAPKLHKVIEPAEVAAKAKLTTPHTVHCLPDGRVMISMLGNEKGEGPGGFLLLDEVFNVAGRWEASTSGMNTTTTFTSRIT